MGKLKIWCTWRDSNPRHSDYLPLTFSCHGFPFVVWTFSSSSALSVWMDPVKSLLLPGEILLLARDWHRQRFRSAERSPNWGSFHCKITLTGSLNESRILYQLSYRYTKQLLTESNPNKFTKPPALQCQPHCTAVSAFFANPAVSNTCSR